MFEARLDEQRRSHGQPFRADGGRIREPVCHQPLGPFSAHQAFAAQAGGEKIAHEKNKCFGFELQTDGT